MKKRILSLLMTLCMQISVFSTFSINVSAASTPSEWASDEVNAAINEGLVTDKVTKDYQKAITREEFCELVVKLYGKLSGEEAVIGNDPFFDTDNTEILKAHSLGIVKGISETEFAPNNNITRQELCVMLVRAIEAILDDEFILKYDFYKFDDSRDIADWAFEQVYYAYEKGIVKGVGDNKINPLGTATCEQAIIIMYRLHENIDECETVIPQEVIDRHENYTYVNNTFKEIEKKYTDENGYVIPESIEAVLNEVYASALDMIENGDVKNSQLNVEHLNVCVTLKDGAYYIYTPSLEGMANYPQKTTEIVEFDNFPPFEVLTRQKAGNTAANKFDFCDYSYIDTNEKSISALKAKLSSLNSSKKCIIYWHGHGSVGYYSTPLSFHEPIKNGVPIYSGVTLGIPEKASIETQYKFQSDIDEYRIVLFKDSYGLTPLFFDTYLSNVESGLFFAGACQSLCDKGELAKVFIHKGFDTYIGSSMSISTQYVNNFMDSFGAYLCEYTDKSEIETITVEEALQKTKEKHGATDWNVLTNIYNTFTGENLTGAEFFYVGNSDFRLMEPWRAAYAKILREDGQWFKKFELCYIDDDNIPELILLGGEKNSSWIYTYANDQAEPMMFQYAQDLTDSNGKYESIMYKEKDGVIFTTRKNYDFFIIELDNLVSNELICKIFHNGAKTGNPDRYWIEVLHQESEISREQYDQALVDYGYDKVSTEFKKIDYNAAIDITETNIKEYFE